MHNLIPLAIKNIEQGQGIKIIYAAEAGSRAWGFPSQDSDYDIRIIYVRPLRAILKVHPLNDSFEHKIIEEVNGQKVILDIAGWDLTKALGLLAKSNPPLIEWLESPIKYEWRTFPREDFLALHNQFFDKRAFLYHYANMAARCLAEHLHTPSVKLKKYFYCIRPLLAAHYVLAKGSRPPVDFLELFDSVPSRQVLKDAFIRGKINDLYVAKIGSLSESDRVPVDIDILQWIESQITGLRSLIPTIPARDLRPQSAFDALDTFLYRMVVDHEKGIDGMADSA